MANQFDSIFVRKPRRNKFNLSYQNKLTVKFGNLTPFLVQDVLPGDHFKVGSSHVIRMQPTVTPVMQNVDIYKHYFFVPNRLIWDKWEEFITGGVSGNAQPTPLRFTPKNLYSWQPRLLDPGSLLDYLGYPTVHSNVSSIKDSDMSWDAMPALAYTLIWQEYYRDQNLVSEVTEFPVSSLSTLPYQNYLVLRQRCWKKDEFTSALPWPQRAGQSVQLPINVDSTISRDSAKNVTSTVYKPERGGVAVIPGSVTVDIKEGNNMEGQLQDGEDMAMFVDSSAGYKVESSASLANVTEIRRAFKVQEWLEAMASGGARYVEQIARIFGVRTSDGRLQRPLYLGGTCTPLVMEATAQTSASSNDAQNPSVQGNLAGNGASVASDFIFKNRFEEHGWIIGIMSIIPRSSYYQGVPKKFSRFDRFDYYWPQFAHIGEQPILKRQIYLSGIADKDISVFGYEPRYAEYRFNNDEVHGEFRTNLKQWHLARDLDSNVELNRSFVEVPVSVGDRVMAVDSFNAAPFLCVINNNILASRLISKYGTPRL